VEGRRDSIASSGARSHSSVASSSTAARLHERRRKRSTAQVLQRQTTIKNLLMTMNLDWMARFEQHAAVYSTQVIVVVLSVIAYLLETLPSLDTVVDRRVW